MLTEHTIEELRKNYKRLQDTDLIRLATHEAGKLRAEAVQAIKDEINFRGLSGSIIKGVEVQLKELSDREVMAYSDLIRKQRCPICHSNSKKLNAAIVKSVLSVIYFSRLKNKFLIACPDCLMQANKSAQSNTVLGGWWEFPRGPIRTIQAINFNNKMKEEILLQVPNEILKSFVKNNAGKIESIKDNEQEIQSFIKYLQ